MRKIIGNVGYAMANNVNATDFGDARFIERMCPLSTCCGSSTCLLSVRASPKPVICGVTDYSNDHANIRMKNSCDSEK